MSHPEHNDRHLAAKSIAVAAGAIALDYFINRDKLIIENKANAQDVVSIADQNVETFIRDQIAQRFPDDGVLGEEHAPTPTKSGYTWIIDPIDGTSPFVMGMPDWCVSIAVFDGTKTVASAIFAPRVNDLYDAVLDGGAFLNGKRMSVEKTRNIQSGLTGLGANFRIPKDYIVTFLDRLLTSGGMPYRNGSGALMLAYVASGKLVGYFEPHINAWDCMAALLMVDEAGGWTHPFAAHGDLTKGDVVIASNLASKDALITLSNGLHFPNAITQ